MRCPHCDKGIDLEGALFCASCGRALPPSDHDPFVGTLVGGRYRVTTLVAEGGMGRIYAAEQEMGGTKRKVAIKVLLSQYAGRKADVTRFMRECSTVSELEHPNTIKFYDFGDTDEGDLYIAMEFVRGRSLARELIVHGMLSPERVDLIVGQICGSLQEAHDKGIIHRDLKPDNIILTDAAGQGDFVKVLDFGIAKRIDGRDPKLTPLGVVLGSPPYMSPEQFTVQDVDARSDIYSLGVLAYQCLTGQMPFEAQEMLHWATLHMTEAPQPFEETDTGMLVPGPMRRAVLRALAKDADQRPPSMRDFYAEFTVHERKSLPAGRASVVPHPPSHLGDLTPPPPLFEQTGDRDSRQSKTLIDDSLSNNSKGDNSVPIPLLPRPGRMPAEMGAQPTRPASDFSDDPMTRRQEPPREPTPRPRRGGDPFGPVGVTVPELVPPTVRDPSLIAPPPGAGLRWWIPAIIALAVGIGGASAWMVYRGTRGDTSQSDPDPAPIKPAVGAPPTVVDSAQAPFPDFPVKPRPSNAPPAPPGEEHSPCQTAMVAALSSKCDLARRALVRCPDKSQHRASAVRAVEALCAAP